MSRSRASARQAGPKFERDVADCFARELGDDRIDRRVKTGAKDKGDIAGLRVRGLRVVVEVKEYGGRFEVGKWLKEAETERINDDALAGIVVAKRRGTTDPLEQVVFMTMADLLALIGTAPNLTFHRPGTTGNSSGPHLYFDRFQS